jgi:hypothetical protein
MLDIETIVYRILMRRALVLVLVPVLWYGVRYDDRWYFHLMRFPATVRHAPFYSSSHFKFTVDDFSNLKIDVYVKKTLYSTGGILGR